MTSKEIKSATKTHFIATKKSKLSKDNHNIDDIDDNTIMLYSIDDPRYTVQIKHGYKWAHWNDLPATGGQVDASIDLSVNLEQVPRQGSQYYCPNVSCDARLQPSNQALYCPKCCMVFQSCPVCSTENVWLKLIHYGRPGVSDKIELFKAYVPESTLLTGPYIDEYTHFHWACNKCRGRFTTTGDKPCQQVLWKTGVKCERCNICNMSGTNEEGYTCESDQCKNMDDAGKFIFHVRVYNRR